ncbi:MAG TPA: hypothetical protein VN751_10045 [Solirubrobacteraceae bacterium]|nr:hypothetical protein [Solirubrobacteraceae bacterium]
MAARLAPLALAAIALGGPPAAAIPWDAGGAIPPARTPPPARADPFCRQSYADDAPRGGLALRLGIGPRLAGQSGAAQTGRVVPENARARDAALLRLAGRRSFTVRLNRLFSGDGAPGIARFRRQARHFARLGLDVELQVRYHPRPAQDGDLGAWLRFVRQAVRAFGPIRRVAGLQITNEVNLKFSPNTSDGAYRGAVPALVEGVVAAKREARRHRFRQLRIGFNAAWRFGDGDAAFWRAIGRRGGARLRRATDWVGVDLYPGTFAPPAAAIVHLGDAFLEGLAQMRECYLPLAGFGRSTPLRVEETGWPTGPGRSEAAQRAAVRAIVGTAVRYRGTYHVTDLRWFGLRDNDSSSADPQARFGLLRDDYARKPAFAAFRCLVARYGAPP